MKNLNSPLVDNIIEFFLLSTKLLFIRIYPVFYYLSYLSKALVRTSIYRIKLPKDR